MQVPTRCSKTLIRHTCIKVIEMIIVDVAITTSKDEGQRVDGCSTVHYTWWRFLLEYQDVTILAYLVQGKVPLKSVKKIEITQLPRLNNSLIPLILPKYVPGSLHVCRR